MNRNFNVGHSLEPQQTDVTASNHLNKMNLSKSIASLIFLVKFNETYDMIMETVVVCY